MLLELLCDKFRVKKIEFHEGLNALIGDDLAANSIGKSTLLMAIDFAFGGDTYIEKNSGAVEELGHHDYRFRLKFGEESYYFKRGTENPSVITRCNEKYEQLDEISLDSYKKLLKSKYALDYADASFRDLVGLYSRIWGKPNVENVNQPLHITPKKSASEAIDTLINLFDKFSTISDASTKANRLKKERSILTKARDSALVPKINKREFNKNKVDMNSIKDELADINQNLAKYAYNLSEIAGRQVLSLKVEKDRLVSQRLDTEANLARLRNNLKSGGNFRSSQVRHLEELFPSLNVERLDEIDGFHRGIAKILREDLKAAIKKDETILSDLNKAIEDIDEKLALVLSRVEKPELIIDKVYELAVAYTRKEDANNFHKVYSELETNFKAARDNLKQVKDSVLKGLQADINDRISLITDQVYGPERQKPKLTLSDKSYQFDVPEDSGTGKAYGSLVIFDLSILKLSKLPFLIHDSVLFKNVENAVVSKLLEIYSSFQKQVFISIDEIEKYGARSVGLLTRNKIIKLSNNELLFTKDWRSRDKAPGTST